MISQIRNQLDIVEKVIEVKNKRARKSDDQQSFIYSIISSTPSTSTPDNKGKCSFKQYLISYQRLRDIDHSEKRL